ncbi:MAG TPA: hypothetical protein VGG16_06150, partial [Streptosporangiaceae bacterium]
MRFFRSAEPDIRGPWRYLLWMAATHWRIIVPDFIVNVLWVAGQALTPTVIGEAVNAGLIDKDQTALTWWGMAVLGLGIVQALGAMLA